MCGVEINPWLFYGILNVHTVEYTSLGFYIFRDWYPLGISEFLEREEPNRRNHWPEGENTRSFT